MQIILPRSSTIPSIRARIFTIYSGENQSNNDTKKQTNTPSIYSNNLSSVVIKVFEGERSMTKDNNLLGTFELSNISLPASGEPQIEITFDIDANSILKVSALDKTSAKEKIITITNDKGCLSRDEIKRIILMPKNINKKMKHDVTALQLRIHLNYVAWTSKQQSIMKA
ncbi:unnamed protein product [Rotaria sp. Silwood2]|nr:unnamed protein product [Rotaria sp. Silwood2]